MDRFPDFYTFIEEVARGRDKYGDPYVKPNHGVYLDKTYLTAYSYKTFFALSQVSPKQTQNLIPLHLFSKIKIFPKEAGSAPEKIRMFYTEPDFGHLFLCPDKWQLSYEEARDIKTTVVPMGRGAYPLILAPDSHYTRLPQEKSILSLLDGLVYISQNRGQDGYYTDADGMRCLEANYKLLRQKYGFDMPNRMMVDESLWREYAKRHSADGVLVKASDYPGFDYGTWTYSFRWGEDKYILVDRKYLDFPGLQYIESPKEYPSEYAAIIHALEHPDKVKRAVLAKGL